MKKTIATLALVFVGIGTAIAQTPAAPAAAAGANANAPVTVPAVPASNCIKPDYPGRLASDSRIRAFNRYYKAYADCVSKYVTDMQGLIKDADASARTLVDEFNALTTMLKAEAEKAKE